METFLSGQIAVWLVAGTFLALIAIRYLHAFVTGYILPDEAWYYITFILEGQRPFYREVFQGAFLLFFHGVRDVFSFLWRGLFYSILWTLGSLLLMYKALKISGASKVAISLVLLTVPFFAIFPAMAPFIVTEPVGLFFAMLGIYLLLLHLRNEKAKYALLSAVAFVLASKAREPYLIFAVGNLGALLFLRRDLRSIISYAIPVAIVAPIPVRLDSLSFSQPVYTLITRLVTLLTTTSTAQGGPPSQSMSVVDIPTLTRGIFSPTIDIPVSVGPFDVVQAIAVSLQVARNPLFVSLMLISMIFLAHSAWISKSRVNIALFYNAILAAISFVVPIMLILSSLPAALTAWTSTIIRASHTGFPMLAGFKDFYSRPRIRRIAPVLLVLMLAFTLVQFNAYGRELQASLSQEAVNRLSLDYRAPYYRLYLIAQNSGHTLVLGLHLRGIRVYMSMLPNVAVLPVPSAETAFQELTSRGWDTIFLYDDWLTIRVPSMLNAYPPYYRQILLSQSYFGYIVEALWVDGESYALRMTKGSAVTGEEFLPTKSQVPCLFEHYTFGLFK